MASRQFTEMLASRLAVPSPYEDSRVADVMTGGQKRGFSSVRDMTDTIMDTMSKRRFSGDDALGPLRSAVPDQLARRMNVVNAGISTDDAQTDEEIQTPIMIKPYAQGWEQDFTEKMALWSNRVEPDLYGRGMHTVASVPILNFVFELGALTASRNALVSRAGVADDLLAQREYLEYMVPMAASSDDPTSSLAEAAAEKWSYLGPMHTFLDSDRHSSNPAVRRSQGAQRMINWSVFNRSKTFNMFSPELRKGDHMFYAIKEVDVSHIKDFVDPRGSAVVARTTFPARALQVVGFTERDAPIAFHDTSYDPIDGVAFTEPGTEDLDYMERARRLAQDYSPIEIDDNGEVRFVSTGGEADAVAEALRQTPEIVYRAYMEGRTYKVGVARSFEGRRPSLNAIAEAHRSHSAMKQLQTVEIYNV